MSGFEIAGVVLTVLPLFTEAGKAYTEDASAMQKAASRSARDKALHDFYQEFWWNTAVLRWQMERIVQGLPSLSEERKQEVIDGLDLENLDKAVDVAEALRAFFASEKDHEVFQHVMGNVLKLFARLVKDETVYLSKSDQVSSSQ